jgi:hypothetical protein
MPKQKFVNASGKNNFVPDVMASTTPVAIAKTSSNYILKYEAAAGKRSWKKKIEKIENYTNHVG